MKKYGRRILATVLAVGMAISTPGINSMAREYNAPAYESEATETEIQNIEIEETEAETEETTVEDTEVTDETTEEVTEETTEETTEATIEETTEDTTEDSEAEITEELDADQATVTYDASTMSTFKGRTLQDVIDKYSEVINNTGTYEDGKSSTYYVSKPSTVSPYAQGKLTSDTLKTMHDMTNYYRWLMGAKPLTADCVNSDSLQKGALVRYFHFSHTVDSTKRPADFPESLWNEGASVSHNILAWGTSPMYSINNWMNEGYTKSGGWGTLGHRGILSAAKSSNIQFGYVGSTAIGSRDASSNTMPEAFTAFPCPGYMPNNLISPGGSAWSIEYNKSKLSYTEANIVVTVTNVRTNESYQCTKANGKLYFENYLYGDLIGFAQPFDYSGSRYTDSYKVEITGFTDKATSSPAVLKYQVDFVDIEQIMPSNIEYVTMAIRNYEVYKDFATTDNLKKLASVIPTEITVIAENNKTATFATDGIWKVDEVNHIFYNSIDKSKLTEDFKDDNGKLDKITVGYTIVDDKWSTYNELVFEPEMVYEGESIRVSTFVSLNDTTRVFKIYKNEKGEYCSKLWLDSNVSPEFDAETSKNEYFDSYKIFNINNLTEDNTGEYISIACDVNGYNLSTNAYVSISTKNLTVKHKHIYEDLYTIDSPATCTVAGSKSRHCSICDAKTDVTTIPALGHDITKVTTQVMTCTQDKIEKETCSRCDYEKEITTPTTGHSYSTAYTIDKEATCTTVGSKSRHCTKCTAKTNVTTIVALGHDITKETIQTLTCTQDKIEKETCSRCDYEKEITTATTGHSYRTTYTIDKEATCTTAGSKSKHCSKCDAKTDITEIVALGHNITKTTIQTLSCTQDKIEKETCSRCDYENEIITATTGHSYSGTYTIDKEVTCTTAGSKSRHCTKCTAKTDVTEIAAFGHDITIKTVQEMTCTKDQIEKETCSRCDYENEIVTATPGHNYSETYTIDKPVTCTTSGSKSRHCSICDAKTDVTVIAALGHSVTSETIQSLTCTQDGIVIEKCYNCDYENEIVTKASGHDLYTEYITATCTEPGTAVELCHNCDYRNEKTINTPGHEFYYVEVEATTCLTDGTSKKLCKHCDYEEIITEVAPGHDIFTETEQSLTCTQDGITVEKCRNCDYENEIRTPAAGHTIKTTITNATCTKSGKRHEYCTKCTYYKDTTLKAIGHNNKKVITKATPTSNGKIVNVCERCKLETPIKTIYKASKITLATTTYTYDGKAKTPVITVKDSQGNTIEKTNYNIQYVNNIKPGKATVTIKFIGNEYTGTEIKTFVINPKGTSLKTLSSKKDSRKIKITWAKQTTETSGYEIQYSLKSNFASKKKATVSKSKTTYTTGKLVKGKTYYVRIRTYKTVKEGGKSVKYYSKWSAVKKIKVK